MIKKIRLKNFQGHKETELEFHPGINAIVGNSNKGKTSILRALNLIKNNRPTGSSFISKWAKSVSKKDNIIKTKILEPCEVELENDNGIISRIKNKDTNCYKLNGASFSAVGADVPDEVQTALNLSEVNIQKQMDGPFLISKSDGEVARFLNSLVKLDDIDKVLSNTISIKTKLNREFKAAELNMKSYDKQLYKFEGLDDAEKSLLSLEDTGSEVNKIMVKLNTLNTSFDRYFKTINERNKHKTLSNLKPAIELSLNLYEKMDKKQEKINKINKNLLSFKENSNKIIYKNDILAAKSIEKDVQIIGNKLPELKNRLNKTTNTIKNFFKARSDTSMYADLPEIKDKISKLDRIANRHLEKMINWTILEKSIVQGDLNIITIIENKQLIKEFKDQMPDICPTCKQPLKGE